MIRSKIRRFTLLLGVCLLLVAALTTVAQADPVNVKGDVTKLTIDPGIVTALAEAGIQVLPVEPAQAKPVKGDGCGLCIQFPITQGRIAPDDLAGTIWHSGGLLFVRASDGAMLKATDFKIDTVEQVLYGLVGDAYVPLLDLDLSAITVQSRFPKVIVGNVGAALTETAAGALNATFGTELPAGLRIGTARAYLRLPCYGQTEVRFEPGVWQALSDAMIQTMPIWPGRVDLTMGAPWEGETTSLVYTFRITKRTLADGGPERIWHSGGLRFVGLAPCSWMNLTSFLIDVPAGNLRARVDWRGCVPIFDLDLSEAVIGSQGPYTTIGPVHLALTEAAATALNARLGTELFTAGLVVGDARVSVRL
jgi:hypothetical protein